VRAGEEAMKNKINDGQELMKNDIEGKINTVQDKIESQVPSKRKLKMTSVASNIK
jgi:hypothetical protein